MNRLPGRIGRSTLPPTALVVFWVVAVLLIDAANGLIHSAYLTDLAPGDPALAAQRVSRAGIHTVLNGFVLTAYVFIRLVYFLPLPGSRYLAWLNTTPWTPARPLPLGPWFPTWADALVVAVLTADTYRVTPEWWAVVPAYLVIWTILGGLLLLPMWQEWYTIAAAAILGLGFHLAWWHPAAGVVVAPFAFAVVALGVRRAIHDLPHWPERLAAAGRVDSDTRWKSNGNLVDTPSGDRNDLGWPYAWLRPDCWYPAVNVRLVRAVVGVAFLWLTAIPWNSEATVIALLLVVAISMLRLGVYVSGHVPALSLPARYGTGRWFVPRFDAVLVAPILSLLVGTGLVLVGVCEVLPARWAYPAAICASTLVALVSGPSYAQWHLTGEHTFVATRPKKSTTAR